jgi:hypothetical protein
MTQTQTNFILNEQNDDVRAHVGTPEMPLEQGKILGGGGGGFELSKRVCVGDRYPIYYSLLGDILFEYMA